MKAYKVTVLVVDHDNLGEGGIIGAISNCRYINPKVMELEMAEIGPWTDEHPLNQRSTMDAEFTKLFPSGG